MDVHRDGKVLWLTAIASSFLAVGDLNPSQCLFHKKTFLAAQKDNPAMAKFLHCKL